jgi:transposase-like protein
MDYLELERESMARTRSIDRRKEAHWREQLALQADSGLGIAAWCRHNQVSLSLFHYWRRTLARRDQPTAQSEPARVASFAAVLVENPPSQPNPQIQDDGLLEIIVPDRPARLRVAPGFDAPTLSRLLDVLERRAC